jgi:hypothetical protein
VSNGSSNGCHFSEAQRPVVAVTVVREVVVVGQRGSRSYGIAATTESSNDIIRDHRGSSTSLDTDVVGRVADAEYR